MASTTLTYRRATPDDSLALLALIGSAYRGDASRTGWTTEADLLEGDRINEEGILAKIKEANGTVLLSHDSDGQLVACCELLKQNDDLGYFGLFAVDPNRQAGGFGRKVLAYAETFAKETWGFKKLEMSVIFTRNELIDWYIRRGYTKTEKTKPFPYEELEDHGALRDDLHFVILEKELV